MIYSVIKIERCRCSLVRMEQYGDQAVVTSHFFQPVEGLNVPAKMTFDEEVEDKETIYTSELTFSTCSEINHEGNRWAYRITLADGTVYIMGSYRRPFPITTKKRTMGPVTGSQIPQYTVLLRNIVPLPKQSQ